MREWASKQDTCDLLEVYNDGERDRLMKNEPCFKGVVANESGGTNNGTNNGTNSSGGSLVQFADSTTLKYSKLIKDENEDEDDEDDLQQRVYDMPSSDSDSDSDSDDDDESLEAVISVKPVAAPKLKTDHINVDDI